MKSGIACNAAVAACLAACAAAFDYDSATNEQQQAWLDQQAERLHARGPFILLRGGQMSGLNPYMAKVVGKASAREVVATVNLIVYDGFRVVADAKREKAALCDLYDGGELHDQKVRLTVLYQTEKGSPVLRVTASPGACESALKQS